MALYVKDPEVDHLAHRLAQLRQVSKTEAVRQALRHELAKIESRPSLVEQGTAFVRDLLDRSQGKAGQPADKEFIDSLYGQD